MPAKSTPFKDLALPSGDHLLLATKDKICHSGFFSHTCTRNLRKDKEELDYRDNEMVRAGRWTRAGFPGSIFRQVWFLPPDHGGVLLCFNISILSIRDILDLLALHGCNMTKSFACQ